MRNAFQMVFTLNRIYFISQIIIIIYDNWINLGVKGDDNNWQSINGLWL